MNHKEKEIQTGGKHIERHTDRLYKNKINPDMWHKEKKYKQTIGITYRNKFIQKDIQKESHSDRKTYRHTGRNKNQQT